MDRTYSNEEKERIFIDRTQREYPKCWSDYLNLVAHEKMGEEELREYNFRKRLEMLDFAYRNTVFYRKFYDAAGLRPEDVKTEKDWDAVPIVTKQMIRENYREFMVEGDVEKFGVSFNTGGSTGIPLTAFRDRRGLWPGIPWRFTTWYAGRRAGEPVGRLPSHGLDEALIRRLDNYGDFAKRQASDAKRLPARRFYLDAMRMGAERIRAFNDEIKGGEVKYVHGYTGALVEYVRHNIEHGYRFPSVPYVAVGVATQMKDSSRKVIEDFFGCPACNAYASREMGWMGTECPCSNHDLHVPSDVCSIDIVDEDGNKVPDGETGCVVVTSFQNHVMPFVRYRIGDRTRYVGRKCACGMAFPLIAPVAGRETDFLIARNGNKVFESDAMFDRYPTSTKAFQFRQHGPGRVSVLVVPDYGVPNARRQIDEMFEEICRSFGEGIDFDLKLVDSIPHDGGKIRFIVYD